MTPAADPTPAPPRTAAVILTRQRPEQVKRCLDAIHGVPLIVVIDNGSADTAGLDERYPGVRFIRLPRNFGVTRALNIGIRAAEAAEFILLLAPEVELAASDVELLADVLEQEPQIGAVCPRFAGVPQVSDLPSPGTPHPPLREAAAGEQVAFASGQAILVRSFFLRALRHVDERYGDYGSAIEICQQVKRANKKILIHPTVTARVDSAAAGLTPEEDADREVGTARFLGKHFGFASLVGYLAPRAMGAIFSFRFPKAIKLISLKKVDGT